MRAIANSPEKEVGDKVQLTQTLIQTPSVLKREILLYMNSLTKG
jgi:hypothetical protein